MRRGQCCAPTFLGRECGAQSQDTRKMFTRGVEFAQVVVGVKKIVHGCEVLGVKDA